MRLWAGAGPAAGSGNRVQPTRYLLWRPSLIGMLLVILLLFAAHGSWHPSRSLFDRLDLVSYDLRMLALPMRSQVTHEAPISIVDVDESSLAEIGRWPWPRDRIAHLVETLYAAGAAVVALDILFAEPELNPAEHVLQLLPDASSDDLRKHLRAVAPELDNDRRLARALATGDTVQGMVLHQMPVERAYQPSPLLELTPGDGQRLSIPRMASITANIPVLSQASPYHGFVTTLPDRDGVIRRSPLLLRHGDSLYSSLALEAARAFLLIDEIELDVQRIGETRVVESISLEGLRIPTDALGRVLIPYRGGARSFPTLSALAVMEGDVPANLAGRVVFIGTSALGLGDLRATPVQSVFPGVEIHANILAGLLAQRFPQAPAWIEGAQFALLAGLGIVLALVLPVLGPVLLTLVTLAIATAWLGVNAWVWVEHGLALPVAPVLFLVLLLGAANMAYGFLFETRHMHELKGLFGQYVPPQLVEEMSADPRAYHCDGESREMSVLFADIRGFTSLSEQLSAAELRALLNRFFTPMTEIIFDNRGTIDKYVGDMIMAFWAAPLDDPDHAEHAVQAALSMLDTVRRLRAEFVRDGLPEIDIGIGINSGSMHVGDMGSDYRRAYTVLGDAVNLASRLEGLTKFYGEHLVVGEQTCALAPGYLYRKLDRVRVKGKREAVTVYAPLCPLDSCTDHQRTLTEQLDNALECFWKQDWDNAQQRFRVLLEQDPDTALYGLYLSRIESLRDAGLPASWDGVYERREK